MGLRKESAFMKTKISAEEKHYQKLNSKLTKELKQADESSHRLFTEKMSILKQFSKLENKLKCIMEENDMLKSKLNLSDDEVKQIVKSSNYINDIGGLMNTIGYGGLGLLEEKFRNKSKRPEPMQLVDQDGKIV